MKKHHLFISLLLIGGLSTSAQDTTQGARIKELMEIIVPYRANVIMPFSFTNLNAASISRKSTGQEPSFLLSETPSMTVYSDAGNTQGYSYMRMRGIDQARINISLDGVPLNDPEDQGAYFSNYPDIFNSASLVQVQRGAGTTKNGTACFGGSVQLFSPRLNDSSYTGFGLGYGSYNSLRAYAVYNTGMKKNKGLYVRASQIYSDGYKYHSANNSQSAFISGEIRKTRVTWKMNLLAGHQQNQLAWLGVKDSLIEIDPRTNVNINERDKFTQCLAQLQNWRDFKKGRLQTGLYYTFLDGNYDFNLNTFLGFPPTDDMFNYAFRSHLTGLFSNYSIQSSVWRLTGGIHGNTYQRRHTGSETSLGQLYTNTGHKYEYSVFGRGELMFNQLVILGELQYRHTGFYYKGSVPFEQLQWDFLNVKGGFTYMFDNRMIVYYSLATTGREPTRNDIFGGNDDLLADNTGKALLFIVKPEYVTDHEAGIRFMRKKFSVDANLYYMEFKNEIVLNGKFGPNGIALTNSVGKSFRTGAELSFSWKVHKRFTLVNNSSYNYSMIRDQQQEFSPVLTPPIIINQEFIYSLKHISMAASLRYQDASYIDFANSTQVNAYFLANARLTYTHSGFEISIYGNNLTNTRYFNHGYVDTDGSKKYFVQAPVNYYISVKYIF